MLGRRGPLSKLIGGGIGLAKEYQADRKSRKEASENQEQNDNLHKDSSHDNDDDGTSSEEGVDDDEWAQTLDEAQCRVAPAAAQSAIDDDDESTFLANFMRRHPPPPYALQQPSGVLSKPVILPQRRPESHTRGFVRAYAAVLEDAGIDQATWFEFLDGLDKSITGNGWFHALNVAAGVAGKIRLALEGISLIAHLVFMAIHAGVEGGRRTYIHSKHNKYFDTMNDEFFKPRGLYCLLLKYKPKSDEAVEEVDMQKRVTEIVAKRDDEDRSKWKNLVSSAADKTTHEEELPEFAPLEFPVLDKLDEQQKQNAFKHLGLFLQDYYDRQAQAKFDGANPGSKLAGVTPRKDFASQYSDPNSQVSQGGLISTISGGKYNHKGPLGRIRDRRGGLGIRGNSPAGTEGRRQRRSKRPIRILLKSDTLYLMVVNMPTQKEMERIRQATNSK